LLRCLANNYESISDKINENEQKQEELSMKKKSFMDKVKEAEKRLRNKV